MAIIIVNDNDDLLFLYMMYSCARRGCSREGCRSIWKGDKEDAEARESEKRKAKIERKHAQRAQAKKSFQNAKDGEKRSVDDDEIDGPRKRVRNVRSQIHNQRLMTKSSKQLDSTVNGLSNDINNEPVSASDALQLRNADRQSNSLLLTSDRSVRLPARFRWVKF